MRTENLKGFFASVILDRCCSKLVGDCQELCRSSLFIRILHPEMRGEEIQNELISKMILLVESRRF